MSDVHDVLIVGGGLAGLACALDLHGAGAKPLVLEASDGVGGRVRTDLVDGFRLDRGFQVILESYPECRRVLDYEALELTPFYPGAQIWTGRGFARFADPLRHPGDAMAALTAPVGSFSDKFRVARFRKEVMKGAPESLLYGKDRTTLEDLRAQGFGPGIIDGFFRPFFGGVLLNSRLTDSSRIFRYIFRMFSEGNASVPGKGMGEIPLQLAGRLPEGAVRLGARVVEVAPGKVTLESGEELLGEAVVVAVEGPEAARLLPGITDPGSKSTVCLYFDAPEPPVRGPILVLDGEGKGPVNHLAVVSQVSPDYAPPGRSLISASCLGLPPDEDGELMRAILGQMERWFGARVSEWRHLRTYRISHAQPVQDPGVLDPPERSVVLEPGLFVCGDHRETASLQGALHSGRRAAEAVRAWAQGPRTPGN
jgi:phytoene dehydrogenase-like protein